MSAEHGHSGGHEEKKKDDYNFKTSLYDIVKYELGHRDFINDIIRPQKGKNLEQKVLQELAATLHEKGKEHVVSAWFKAGKGASPETVARLKESAVEYVPTINEIMEDLSAYAGEDGKVKLTEDIIRQYMETHARRVSGRIMNTWVTKLRNVHDKSQLKEIGKALYSDMGHPEEYGALSKLPTPEKMAEKLSQDVQNYHLPNIRQQLGKNYDPTQKKDQHAKVYDIKSGQEQGHGAGQQHYNQKKAA